MRGKDGTPVAVQEQYTATPVTPGTWQLDPTHTSIEFWARHLGLAKVRGRFTDFSAQLVVGESLEDTRFDVTMRADSIETRAEQRDQHLMSPDFLDTEKFSDVKFASTSIVPVGDGRYHVNGTLTIRDVTRPIVLEVELHGEVDDPMAGTKRAGFSATAEFDREDYDMTWNGAIEIGGFVGKKVHIEIEGEALLQKDA